MLPEAPRRINSAEPPSLQKRDRLIELNCIKRYNFPERVLRALIDSVGHNGLKREHRGDIRPDTGQTKCILNLNQSTPNL